MLHIWRIELETVDLTTEDDLKLYLEQDEAEQTMGTFTHHILIMSPKKQKQKHTKISVAVPDHDPNCNIQRMPSWKTTILIKEPPRRHQLHQV